MINRPMCICKLPKEACSISPHSFVVVVAVHVAVVVHFCFVLDPIEPCSQSQVFPIPKRSHFPVSKDVQFIRQGVQWLASVGISFRPRVQRNKTLISHGAIGNVALGERFIPFQGRGIWFTQFLQPQ